MHPPTPNSTDMSSPGGQASPPARQSAPYDSRRQAPRQGPLATPRKRQRQSRIAGHPDHTTDVPIICILTTRVQSS